jgi:hypothetical protein
VIAQEDKAYLYIKNVYSGEVNLYDHTPPIPFNGTIGVYAASINNATQAIFSELAVWNLDQPLTPTPTHK